jgi:hypothetical protein
MPINRQDPLYAVPDVIDLLWMVQRPRPQPNSRINQPNRQTPTAQTHILDTHLDVRTLRYERADKRARRSEKGDEDAEAEEGLDGDEGPDLGVAP